LRTRAPAFQSLKPNEFLLIAISSLTLLDPGLPLLRLLQTVAKVGIAGAAILGDVPADCEAWADDNEIPLFALPAHAHLADVESAIARSIADTRSEFDRRAHELYRQLTQLAIEERGLPSIVEELARVTGKTAWLLDYDLAVRERFPEAVPINGMGGLTRLSADITSWTKRVPISASEPPVKFFDLDGSIGALIAPVMTRDRVAQYVSIGSARADIDALDEAAVAGAAAAAAIELTRERAVQEAEERAQAGVLEEIATGNGPVSESLRRRAARIQFDLDDDHVVLLSGTSAQFGQNAIDATLREARTFARTAHGGVMEGKLILILGPTERPLHGLAESFRESLSRRLTNSEVSTGVGRRLPGLDGLRQSYREAKEALRLGQDVFGSSRTTLYSDLGLYRLLLSVRDHPELDRFYRETMGKLAVQDARSDGELLRTLEAYFTCNGSPTEAAARLHVHRNTLLYRLQRIRSVAEVDLDDPEVRLSLQIALRIRRIIRATDDIRAG
jgi:purine catabolism regulator